MHFIEEFINFNFNRIYQIDNNKFNNIYIITTYYSTSFKYFNVNSSNCDITDCDYNNAELNSYRYTF